MKSYELKPTHQNLMDSFEKDLLDRNKDIFGFADILNSLEDCCSIRETGKYLRLAKMAAYDVTHDNKKNLAFLFAEEKAVRFCLFYILPIMLGLKTCDSDRYENFINGRDSSPLLDFAEIGNYTFKDLLETDETYDPLNDKYKVVTVEEKLDQVYSAIFQTNYNGRSDNKSIGAYAFNKNVKEIVLRAAGLFSKYTYID